MYILCLLGKKIDLLMLAGIGRKLDMTGLKTHSLMGVNPFSLFLFLFLCFDIKFADMNICGE
jgi:hypothetical protein